MSHNECLTSFPDLESTAIYFVVATDVSNRLFLNVENTATCLVGLFDVHVYT